MIGKGIAIGLVVLFALTCTAQQAPHVVLWVQNGSTGPFGGQKADSCLMVYSDGRIVQISKSTSAMGVQDAQGKVTHAERSDNREYRYPERDAWQIDTLLDFLDSTVLIKLNNNFPAPHPPIDYFETTRVAVFLSNGKVKEITTREYYVASLVEKAKYPSALIILMDNIEQLERVIAEKGTPLEGAVDCDVKHSAESTTKKP